MRTNVRFPPILLKKSAGEPWTSVCADLAKNASSIFNHLTARPGLEQVKTGVEIGPGRVFQQYPATADVRLLTKARQPWGTKLKCTRLSYERWLPVGCKQSPERMTQVTGYKAEHYPQCLEFRHLKVEGSELSFSTTLEASGSSLAACLIHEEYD
jgi:hypothetical protein